MEVQGALWGPAYALWCSVLKARCGLILVNLQVSKSKPSIWLKNICKLGSYKTWVLGPVLAR